MSIMGGLTPEAYDRTYSDAELVRRIAAYFRPHRRTVALVATMVVLVSLGATVTPMLDLARHRPAFHLIRRLQLLFGLAAIVTVLGIVSWMFNFVRQRFGARAVGDVVLALREDAFRAVMRRDLSFYDQYASGRIVSRVTSDTQDFATVVTLTIELLSQLVLVVVISIVMLVVNWQLALVTLALAPDRPGRRVGLSTAGPPRHAAEPACPGDRSTRRSRRRSAASPWRKTSGRRRRFTHDFKEVNHLAYRVQLLRVGVFGSIFPLLNTVQGMGVAAVVYVGGLLVLGQSVSVGDWYLFVQSLGIFFFPVTSIASFWSQFQQGLAASERVFALIDADPRVTQTAQEPVAQRCRAGSPSSMSRSAMTVKPDRQSRRRSRLGAARLLTRYSGRPGAGDRWPYRRWQVELSLD